MLFKKPDNQWVLMETLLDTGATLSLISTSLMTKFPWMREQITHSGEINMILANGDVASNLVVGGGFFTIQVGGEVFRLPFFETTKSTTDIVIGHDIISRTKDY